ncbi:YcgL domain-containing protein [Acinetobacter qingfengensis]|uniref:YcgL domain-containing protein BJI46_07345 n=1 Tax=Acinetobacter qingfengensis TaxID=1262585 RepID=A0A1E7RF56_9GAMM|nr:YcgL domain-containing protein [Acinetobacter qingfengensis]KAA8735677.1 YcgL domain-containing protein [Acinetobacter qingfengensis]OEY97877.1 hypothetical protein BJI46_07345 [Acinetobacter qingfengensis]
MHCDIYKSSKKDEMYIYIARPSFPDDEPHETFANVPAMLMQAFGRATFVMNIKLHEQRKLARVSAIAVLEALEKQGYYVQMPPEGLINPNAVEPEGLRGA